MHPEATAAGIAPPESPRCRRPGRVSPERGRRRASRPLTLLELVIALGIVAALASLFLDNLADGKARACEELTIERGEAVRRAVAGDGARGSGGFLSDMGRWPRVHVPDAAEGGDQGTAGEIRGGRRLAELYDPGIWHRHGSGDSLVTALSHRAVVTPEEVQAILNAAPGSTLPAPGGSPALPYPEVVLDVGWRGPYLDLPRPLGARFFDGWGRAWSIVTNHNLQVAGGRLAEHWTGTDRSEIRDAPADFDPAASADARCRIDGIVSRGADGQADDGRTDLAPGDADRGFVFAHPMDTYRKGRLASLCVRLKVRDRGPEGGWIPAAGVRPWDPATAAAHRPGDLVTRSAGPADRRLFVCKRRPAQGSAAWDPADWIDLSPGAAVVHREDEHFDPAYPEDTLRLGGGMVWRKRNGAEETQAGVNGLNWTELLPANRMADFVAVLLFVPVMRETDGARHMTLGRYLFFAGAAGENPFGVVPRSGVPGGADVDARGTDDPGAVYDGYNPRYLVAEAEWESWNALRIGRLVPGRRRIYGVSYDSKTEACQASEAEWLDLKPGENFLELRLERRN